MAATPTDEKLAERIDELGRTVTDFRVEVSGRFGRLEADVSERFGRLEAGIAERFGQLEADVSGRFGRLEAGIAERSGRVDARLARIEAEMAIVRKLGTWLLGGVFGLVATLITGAATIGWAASSVNSRVEQQGRRLDQAEALLREIRDRLPPRADR